MAVDWRPHKARPTPKGWYGSSRLRFSRRFALLASGLAAFVLAACGDDAAQVPSTPPGRALLRTCETAAHGSNPAFQQLTTASPAAAIVFVNPLASGQSDPRFYEPLGDGRFRRIKVLVGVAPGSTVTVVVPEPERGRVALFYDTPTDISTELFGMAEGEIQVTFEACDDPNTGFPGYFLVAGPRCVDLEVHLGSEVGRILLPFGVEDCG